MMRSIKKFRGDTRGVAAIEFALLALPMIITFLGVAEIATYVLAARKVANVASVAADLVTQDVSITDGEMDDVMSVLDVILRPFDPGTADVRITSVVADADGETTVAWSDARNTTALSVNSPVTVPDGIVPDNQGIIMTEVSFTYHSLFGMFLTGGMTVSDTFYLKPRRSTQVLRE
ncbi:MAG: TadE/TadG family type IV pilus assembly protein [Micropepsaceae bacterium]